MSYVYVRDNTRYIGDKSYIADVKSYLKGSMLYIGDTKSYVRFAKSYVGNNNPYAGVSISSSCV